MKIGMMNNVIIVDVATTKSVESYCGYSGSTKYLEKTRVASKTGAICVLGLIALLSFVVLIYAGWQANVWLLIAGFGPLLTSGLAILRIWARSK